jgi:hypothetical protein
MGDAETTLGYENDIKPLFREKDQQRMSFAFDLWSYEDVKENADGILERLEEGDMPCDGAWADDHVATFRTWMQSGMEP